MSAYLDDCLSAKEDKLYIEGVEASTLISRFGSPLFVFSEDQLRRNARRFQAAFSAGWTTGPVDLMPAVKANWLSAIQRILASEGCGADVYSPGELEIALRSGMPPERISVNGVPKGAEHIERALAEGARLTIDSLRDIEILEALAPSFARPAKVRLRLRPAVPEFQRSSNFVAEGPVPTDLVALIYKGGLCFEEAIEAGRRLQALPQVEIVGFHSHHGRHHASTEWWEAQMTAFAREIGRVSEALGGLSPKELDIGGGFAIPRDPHNAAADYTTPYLFGALYLAASGLRLLGASTRYRVVDKLLRFVEGKPKQKRAPSIEEYAAACTRTLLRELPRHRIDPIGVRLQLEPGRALHGNAGVHLTSVCALKKMERPLHWNLVVVDTTEFWLTGGRYEHHLHDFRVANRMSAPATQKVDVVGKSCYGDRVLGAVRLPEVAVGDVLALLDTGAYQEVSASNFNAMPRPAAVLVTGEQAEVIRRAETLDDVFRRDLVPTHLK